MAPDDLLPDGIRSEFIAPETLPLENALVVRTPGVPEAFFWNLLVVGAERPLPTEAELDALANGPLSGWSATGHRTLLLAGPERPEDEKSLRSRGFVSDPIEILRSVKRAVADQATPDPTCRILDPEDDAGWDELVEARVAAASGWPEEAYRRVIRGRLERWREHSRQGGIFWWRRHEANRIVADLGLTSSGQSARYAMIFVRPEARRRGHATALMLAAARHEANLDPTGAIRIGVGPDNPAMALYRKLGFKPESRARYWIRWPEDWKKA